MKSQWGGHQKAPPPQPPQKEKLTKAPPKNLDQRGKEKPPIGVTMEDETSSDESESCGKMQADPIDGDQYEFATGAQIRMKMPSPKEKTTSRETDT